MAAVFLVRFATSPTAKAKGDRAERRVSTSISRSFGNAGYQVIDNVTLPTRTGTTQIDHLIVSPYGVFVVETKNLSGWIFGREDQQNWTQILHKKKYRFFNPIRQNNHHMLAVKRLLKLRSDQIHDVVVFVGNSKFKTVMPTNVVSGIRQLRQFVRSKIERVMSQEEVLRVIAEIRAQRLEPGRETERLHLRNVQAGAHRRSSGCPRCGSPMVMRTNRSTGDPFLGCERYPICRGTRPAP
ncbi:MAG: NERD domain-containing protein [Rhodospirillales bacterium]|nr:NERD domain-containing protein [Rhodospirillales bacterium]